MIVGGRLSWRIVVRSTGVPVLVHLIVAFAIVAADELLGASWLSLPALPLSVLAAALGVLLAFRNNSAYDRWWEARTQWGALVNTSRTFARQVLTFLPRSVLEAGAQTASVASTSSRLLRTAVESPVTAGAPSAIRSSDGAVRDRFGHAREPGLLDASRVLLSTLEGKPSADGDARGGTGPGEIVTEDERELIYAQIGFVNALRCHLRRQEPFNELSPFFRPSVLEALRTEHNVPAAILAWMGTRLRRIYAQGPGPEDIFRLIQLDETLTQLTNILGACERIKNTPIPLQYDILPLTMVRAYLVILPLGLVAELAWATPFITGLIAFLFIAMDAVGRDVETPFENGVSDTPMTALSRTIEINLRQMLGETQLPPPLQPVDGLLY